jgi:hypothetical protein
MPKIVVQTIVTETMNAPTAAKTGRQRAAAAGRSQPFP